MDKCNLFDIYLYIITQKTNKLNNRILIGGDKNYG